jgi:hypothetical protein
MTLAAEITARVDRDHDGEEKTIVAGRSRQFFAESFML